MSGLRDLVAVIVGVEITNRLGSLIDPIDYVAALRWPSEAVVFFALCLTCLGIVDVLGFAAKQLTRRLGVSPEN